MLQLWLIALVAVIYVHDGLRRAVARAPVGSVSILQLLLILAPYVAIAALVHLVCWACRREIDQRGSLRAVNRADWVLAASRMLGVFVYATSVFALGWMEQVRAVTGDLVLIDEIVVLLPPLLLFTAGWWSYYPIEERLRNSVWVRVLEDGHPAYPTPSRWQFVFSNVRHQVLFMLVPLLMMLGLTEGLDRAFRLVAHYRHAGGMVGSIASRLHASPELSEQVFGAIRLTGFLGVFLITPLVMRFVWDAIPLGQGDLRDRLMRVCSNAGVKIRELLVWRTHGTMLNGLAMGVVGPLRYIMLTDALLDNLPRRQVESVMAHEVAHAKHHHIPWMVLGLMALGGIAKLGMIATMVAVALLLNLLPTAYLERGSPVLLAGEVIGSAAALGVFVGVVCLFGVLSRRFEWQADAFAAKQLSKDDPAATTVTDEGAGAMVEALEAVAQLNHIPHNRRSFRHGSMAVRQARLRMLVETPLDRLPIDRTVRWIKGGIVAGLFLALAGAFIEVREVGFMPGLSPRPPYETDPRIWYNRPDGQSGPEHAP